MQVLTFTEFTPLLSAGPLTFRLSAPVTVESLRALRSAVELAIADGTRAFSVDLDGVERLDSQAIATLITLLRLARAAGGSVSLSATRPNLLDTLRITALDRVFAIVPPAPIGIGSDSPSLQPVRSARVARPKATGCAR